MIGHPGVHTKQEEYSIFSDKINVPLDIIIIGLLTIASFRKLIACKKDMTF